MTTHNSVGVIVPKGLVAKLFSLAPEIMNPADLCLTGASLDTFCKALLRAARIAGDERTDKAMMRFSDEQLINTLRAHPLLIMCIESVAAAFEKKLEACMSESIEAKAIREEAETAYNAVLEKEKDTERAVDNIKLLYRKAIAIAAATATADHIANEASTSKAQSAQK